MKQLAIAVKIIVMSLTIIVVWFLAGYQETAFRYMGF